jgi:hypothetical protein
VYHALFVISVLEADNRPIGPEPICIFSDCQAVVDRCDTVAFTPAPFAANGDIWGSISSLFKRIRSKILLRKVRAHVDTVAEVMEHSIPALLVFGNQLADLEAKAGVGWHGTDSNYETRLGFYDAIATIVLKRAVAIFSIFSCLTPSLSRKGQLRAPLLT